MYLEFLIIEPISDTDLILSKYMKFPFHVQLPECSENNTKAFGKLQKPNKITYPKHIIGSRNC